MLYILICKYNTMKKFHNLMVKLQFLHLKVPNSSSPTCKNFFFPLTNPTSEMDQKCVRIVGYKKHAKIINLQDQKLIGLDDK